MRISRTGWTRPRSRSSYNTACHSAELEKKRGIVGTPLLQVNTQFIKSATCGETLTITTHVEAWRAKLIVQMHRITRARANGGDDLICEGREVRAFVKRDDNDRVRLRAIAVPEDIRLLCS